LWCARSAHPPWREGERRGRRAHEGLPLEVAHLGCVLCGRLLARWPLAPSPPRMYDRELVGGGVTVCATECPRLS